MSFLTPLAAAFAVLLPIVVIMYLLKLKRRRVVVPSTLLWRRSVQDLVANAPFQKLRNNLLLYIQLLIIALLIMGLMRPTMKLSGIRGETVVLLIDTSASMQALDHDKEPRLERAKEKALKLVDSMTGGDQMIVVAFNNKTQVVQTLTGDKEALRQAIRSLEAVDTPTDLKEAILILTDLVTTVSSEGERKARSDTRTILVSDGELGPSAGLLVDVPNLEYVKVGDSTENVGIVDLDVRQAFAGTFEYQVFASLLNAGTEDVERFVELSVNGEVLDLKKVPIPAGKTSGVVFTTAERLSGVAQVTVQGDDALPVDNVARGVLAPKSSVNILIVSRGNYFLEKVFNVDPNATVARIAPAEYTPRADYDLTIFDGVSFANLEPGNYVFLNCVPEGVGFQAAEEPLERPVILDWNRVHPLTRFVNLERIIIQKALRVEPPTSAIILAESDTAPMMMLYEKDQTKMLVIPFGIFQSDWPLQASFPIFTANLLDYFTRSLKTTAKPLYRTGEIVPLYPDKTSNQVSIRDPKNEETRFPLDAVSTVYYTQTDRTGVYQVLYEKAPKAENFVVNLLSPDESRIEPVDALNIGGRKVEGQTDVVRTNQEVWTWFLLAALAFLCVEWWLYCRRAWI